MHAYKIDICITHFENNYGPYQLPEKLIPLAITNVLRGRKIPLYGNGQQKRDWLHVLDHCKGIDLVLQMDQKPVYSRDAATDPSKLPIYYFSESQELINLQMYLLLLN
jgi:dTDP-glucose 4,6-dehydratase